MATTRKAAGQADTDPEQEEPLMDSQQLLAALQTEYYHLQKTVEDFDGKAITIKAWSVTFSLTVLVGAFATKAHTVFLIAAAASAMFWCLETLWKSFQLGYYARLEQIEAFMAGESEAIAPHQITSVWDEKWSSTSWCEVAGMALYPHVALPHLLVVIGGVGLTIAVKHDALVL